MGTTRIALHRHSAARHREQPRVVHLAPIDRPVRAPRGPDRLIAAAVAALGLAYGTRIALSLTAAVSIEPGPLAAAGAALGLVLALRACLGRRSAR